LEAKSARVGVIGMGFVLLPLALSFAHTGFATTAWTLRWSMN
jgi:UDP-N-acetyl-D-mannosaminuronate dehydrogenase